MRSLDVISKPITINFILICLLLGNAKLNGQQDSPSRDGEMEKKIDRAGREQQEFWRRLKSKTASPEDDPQIKYAPEFFEYFKKHPQTDTGVRAGSAALMYWSNLRSFDEVQEAIKHIPMDSPLWEKGTIFISNVYAMEGKIDQFIAMAAAIESKLSLPASRSKLLMALGSSEGRRGQFEEAKTWYQAAVDLDADAFDVQRAKRAIYEFDHLNIGQVAPDFQARTIEGMQVQLSDLRGKIVLLDFWAMTCGPCVQELPSLKELVTELDDATFVIVGITDDPNEAELKKFLAERQIDWPQIQQPQVKVGGSTKAGEIADLYNVYRRPRYFLLDRKGRIVAKDKELRGDRLRDTVNAALSQ